MTRTAVTQVSGGEYHDSNSLANERFFKFLIRREIVYKLQSEGSEIETIFEILKKQSFTELLIKELAAFDEAIILGRHEYYSYILGKNNTYELSLKNDFLNNYLALRLEMFGQKNTTVVLLFQNRESVPFNWQIAKENIEKLYGREADLYGKFIIADEPKIEKSILYGVYQKFLWEKIYPFYRFEKRKENENEVGFKCFFETELATA